MVPSIERSREVEPDPKTRPEQAEESARAHDVSTGRPTGTGVTTSPEPPTLPEETPDQVLIGLRISRSNDLSRYRLIDIVGQGGMGVVYLARDLDLDRDVALKMIRSDRLDLSPDESGRFLLEARATAQLRHPNIVPVYTFGTHQGKVFFAMGFQGGGSLAQQIERFQQAHPAKAVALIEKVALAVHHAHTQKILHRDLKPGNILLDDSDEPFVCDFGLARALDRAPDSVNPGRPGPGTPLYMAPEQASGREDLVDKTADVWSLGVILYELLTGQRPFNGDNADAVLKAVLTGEPTAPRTIRPTLDRSLQAVVLRCLRKDPKARYQTATELAEDLSRWRKHEPTVALPLSWYCRATRFIKPYAVMSCVVLLSVLLAGIGSVSTGRTDGRSDDEPIVERLLEIESRLNAGQTVNLIGSDRKPTWHSKLVGHPSVDRHPLEDGVCSIRGNDRSLVELVRNPPRSGFRYEIDVRLGDTFALGEAGLFVAHTLRIAPEGPEHWLYALLLSESKQTDRVVVRPCLMRYRDEIGNTPSCLQQHQLACKRFPRRHAQASGLWYQLAVEVTPDAITAFCEGNLIFELKASELPIVSRSMLTISPAFDDRFPGCASTEGGIGLCITGANVSCRKAVVKPFTQ
jgi:serine/threonine protein kinase